MPAEFLPAASLRSIPRLPAARMPAWVSNRLIGMVLWSIWRVISRWERISSLLSGRGRRSSVESHPRGSHPRQPIIVECGSGGGQRPANSGDLLDKKAALFCRLEPYWRRRNSNPSAGSRGPPAGLYRAWVPPNHQHAVV